MVRLNSVQTLPQTSVLITRSGELLSPVWEENRVSVSIRSIAPSVLTALFATEDRRFDYHLGIDPVAIFRAVVANFRAGRIVQGGSTLTQQLARMSILHRADRSLQRKVVEGIIALMLEVRYTKETILESYLNSAYFGHNRFGIEIAALE